MTNRIYIVHKRLEEIPALTGCVTEVDLRRNNIEKMALSRSETVRYLDLSDNRIQRIKELENIPNLRVLDLSYNLITDLEIPCMGIEELYVISNDISEIRKLNLPRLRKLDLAVNEICKIENLEVCRELEELYLGGNHIHTVGDLRHLEKLKVLDLQNNDIEAIDCNMLPEQVETLLLGENRRLRCIENIERLRGLKILGVEKTGIEENSISHEGITVWYT